MSRLVPMLETLQRTPCSLTITQCLSEESVKWESLIMKNSNKDVSAQSSLSFDAVVEFYNTQA